MTLSTGAGALNRTADLRRALDHAIYTLEGIKLRAARGASSEVAGWYCEEIRELATIALDQLDDSAADATAETAASV